MTTACARSTRRTSARVRLRLRLLSLLAIGVPTDVVRAHAIHTTHTVVSADATGYTLTVRAFADDLSASVARHAGRTPPSDSSVVTRELLDYASLRMPVTDGTGARLVLQSCGMRRVQEAYVLCFHVAAKVSGTTLRLGNQLLADLHADQVNIVQCAVGGSRRTNLFTRGRAATAIVDRGVCATP